MRNAEKQILWRHIFASYPMRPHQSFCDLAHSSAFWVTGKQLCVYSVVIKSVESSSVFSCSWGGCTILYLWSWRLLWLTAWVRRKGPSPSAPPYPPTMSVRQICTLEATKKKSLSNKHTPTQNLSLKGKPPFSKISAFLTCLLRITFIYSKWWAYCITKMISVNVYLLCFTTIAVCSK